MAIYYTYSVTDNILIKIKIKTKINLQLNVYWFTSVIDVH